MVTWGALDGESVYMQTASGRLTGANTGTIEVYPIVSIE